MTRLVVHSLDEQGYSLDQGLIKFQGRLWIGNNSALQTKLISALHSSAVGGHSGARATYHWVSQLFHRSGMKQQIEDWIRQCQICQQAKHERTHPGGLLQPLPVPTRPWKDITMDFIDGLPKSEGFEVIRVVVDHLIKYAHFLPLKHSYTAQSVATIFIDNVVRLHGVPASIVSDRDKVFTSYFWKKLFTEIGTKLCYSTAYHPQTDDQTERVNQCLEQYLRCAVHDSPAHWKRWFPMAEFWYNSSYHTSLGNTPFKALYGVDPNFGTMPIEAGNLPTSLSELAADREDFMATLHDNLLWAQQCIKLQADKHRKDREFAVGEEVLLKLQPYAQSSLVNHPCHKLALKYFGPFRITAHVGAAAYRLDLPTSSLIHPVFHIS